MQVRVPPGRAPAALATTLCLGLVGALLPGLAVADEVIEGDVLTRVAISSTLNCDVQHADDTDPEFFASTACGTLAVANGVLYGPTNIPAGSDANPRTPYTPLSQTKTGDGTAAAPWKITTKVALGDTGIELTQVDSYIKGDAEVATRVSLVNGGAQSASVRLYRAGDCYLGNSDYGLGALGDNWVACTSASTDRAIKWVDLSGGASRVEDFYATVWGLIGQQSAFPNTAVENSTIDNGAGLSWEMTLAEGATSVRDSRIVFGSNVAPADSDHDGFTDDQERDGFTVGGQTFDLKAMGADPNVKDLFIAIDWMQFVPDDLSLWDRWFNPVRITRPTQAEIDDLIHAYAIAPEESSGGSGKVNLHVKLMDTPVSARRYLTDVVDPTNAQVISELRSLQTSRLSALEQRVYHYVLLGEGIGRRTEDGVVKPIGSSGYAEMPGNLVFVARRSDGEGSWLSGRELTGTLMHELGHNLALHHGGQDDYHCKPGYESVMNYKYQMAGADGVVTGIDYARGPENTRTLASPITDDLCKGDYALPVGSYTVYNDWSAVRLDQGAGLLASSGIVSTVFPDEPSTTSLIDFAGAALNGQGSASLVAPGTLIHGSRTPNQSLTAVVENLGQTEATFTVRFTSEFVTAERQVTLPARGTARVPLPVPAAAVPAAGAYDGELVLEHEGVQVSQQYARIFVTDLTAEQLAELQTALKGTLPEGVDPEAAARLLEVAQEAAKPSITFTDVPEGSQFYTEITWIADRGITSGWPDGTFRPVQPIQRDAMAAFMYRLAGEPEFTPPATPSFADVAPDNEFYKEIEWMKAAGLTTGWPDGTYRPGAPINRDAMAAFLYRLNGSPAVEPSADIFVDVNPTTMYAREIAWLAASGITTGYPDRTFRPISPVNRDAMAAFMFRYVDTFGAPTP